MSSPQENTPEVAATVPEASSSSTPAVPETATVPLPATVPAPATTTTTAPVLAPGPTNLVPDDADDLDSALGDVGSLNSGETSIGSSIFGYRQENGRTYHAYKDGIKSTHFHVKATTMGIMLILRVEYMYPNDGLEQDRLDHLSETFKLYLDGKLHMCVFDKEKKIQSVLDVGTGTGVWAMGYGEEHPEAKVLGVDLSPIQPNFWPPNVKFQIDDAEDLWTYSHKFDFIYSRVLMGSLQNWVQYFMQAFENLTPGGYIETTDVCFPIRSDDGTLKPDSALAQWSDLILEASAKIGRAINSAELYHGQMQEAGFVDIVENVDFWPLNQWMEDPKYKEIGIRNTENLVSGISGLSMALFTRVHGWSMEEVEVFLVNVRKDIMDTSIHSYIPLRTIYGRTPSQVSEN
ncbi:S-adenosyl-L-methionine-dependent methyltransferase [Amylocarpus encephaloides]|uniref:S-adenosyl-L-methionine-dependent methyltransferase n=1 Tax=Amylocarpus encephaloides TaxID=45428 RepID=A0A9P7YRT2_9HELO|nr:S-adenosyl-L-methionine-dependent methyltransferase [Amylocarpus encephaloides]